MARSQLILVWAALLQSHLVMGWLAYGRPHPSASGVPMALLAVYGAVAVITGVISLALFAWRPARPELKLVLRCALAEVSAILGLLVAYSGATAWAAPFSVSGFLVALLAFPL